LPNPKASPSKPQKAPRLAGDEGAALTERFLKSHEGQRLLATYAEQLKLYLEQNKRYPRAAIRLRHSGTVKVRLHITTDGRFADIRVINPSPFPTLNKAAVQLLRELGRFKPLPESFKKQEEFVIPIAYHLTGGAQ
jgi:TonB family protein